VLVALFLLDVRLALFALPMIPILAAWILLYRRVAGRINRFLRARLSDINAMINESIQGMPIIRAFRREERTNREFDELNRSYFAYQNKLVMLNALTSYNLVHLLRNMMLLVMVLLFAGDLLGPSVTVGVLYAAIELINRMMNPVVGIVNQLPNLETARVSAERVFELLDEPGVDVSEGDMPRYRGDVEFRNVSFAYKDGETVLHNISFHARPGETVALVGHTGSGKSTIMNLLFRFYDIQQGSILIDGKDIREWSRQHLRRHMGIVLQDPFLFTGTIASNVSLGIRAFRGSGWNRRCGMWAPTTCSRICRAASTSRSWKRARRFRPDSGSSFHSPGRWRSIRRFSFWTRRLPASIPRRRRSSSARSMCSSVDARRS